jgi:hypothetical protein
MPLTTRPLTPETWPDFARLVEANNGIWGGCWCIGFHAPPDPALSHRDAKEALVRQGRAHAALVYDGPDCLGWCQFGPTAELPRIKNARAYNAANPVLPDWRIACFFSGKGHRHKGVAATGLAGAVTDIARLGGGVVEGYPEDTEGRKVSGSFLWNGTLAMFEQQGFARDRKIGKDKWVVTRRLP